MNEALSALTTSPTIHRGFVALGFALTVLTACSGDSTAPPAPSDMQIVSGDNQTWFAGYALPNPLVVVVKDASGKGIPDVRVNWSVNGDGTFSAAQSITNADGEATANYTLGTGTGSQLVTAEVNETVIKQIFTITSGTGWPNMTSIVHFDGSTWSPSLKSNVPGFIKLTAIWGSAANDIFAIGTACGEPARFHFDGTTWGTPQSCTGGSFFEFQGMWGNSGADIFATYKSTLPPSTNTGVEHYNGQTWASSYSTACSFCAPSLRGVWSRSSSDAISVGDGGKILHYDGTNWNPETSGTTNDLLAVWGSGSNVFAVGAAGTVLYNNGSGWIAQSSGTSSALKAVWGASPTDVFAVGQNGVILHYNGTSWTANSSGTTEDLNAVWGSSGNAVFAVGNKSTIRFYNGSTWASQPAGAPIDLRGIWGASPTNVFAVGIPLPPQ